MDKNTVELKCRDKSIADRWDPLVFFFFDILGPIGSSSTGQCFAYDCYHPLNNVLKIPVFFLQSIRTTTSTKILCFPMSMFCRSYVQRNLSKKILVWCLIIVSVWCSHSSLPSLRERDAVLSSVLIMDRHHYRIKLQVHNIQTIQILPLVIKR